MPRKGDPGQIVVGTGMASNNSVDANSFTNDVVDGSTAGLNAHIKDPKGAHAASAISIDGDPFYDSDNVEGALDELAALIPPRVPTIGNYSTLLGISGITDWGALKLLDAGLGERGDITFPVPAQPNDDANIYPYYHFIPAFADESPPFDPFQGNDPLTDPTFNVVDGAYTGGGPGTSHFGGFNRDIGGPPNELRQTARILPSEGLGVKSFVLSGVVSPADRGVVALFYWPPAGGVAEFLAQDLTDRVVAAILLGQGLSAPGHPPCDGAPGGIFTLSTSDPEDPFTYPGRASGQYDLVELHTGLVGGTGPALPAPFSTPNPSGGQVRLGQDPAAGVPIVAGGIPILGATTNSLGQDGMSFGGNDDNFFRYRLPYVQDYSSTTGLVYVPAAEKFRYFEKPSVALNPGTDLTQAGDYTNLPKDYWHFQLARYRHRATFPTGFPNPPDPRDMGSYVLVHFKTERDFELYARDGIMPNDPTACYHIYSASLTNWEDPEDATNLTTGVSPADTAPGYHVVRASNYEDPEALDPLVIVSNNWDYTRTADQVMTISGVHYFIPGAIGSQWQIESFAFQASGYWENSYRLSQDSGTGQVTLGLEGPDAAFVYLMFSAEAGNISHAGATDFDGNVLQQRIEFGYDDLDQFSAHGPYNLGNAPEPTDDAGVTLTVGNPNIFFAGDVEDPFFTQDAIVRWFFRSPLGHASPTTALLPAQGEIVNVADGKTILFHTTRQNPSGGTGDYGNFNTGAIPSAVRAGLETDLKDVQERFLDEVYRYRQMTLYTTDPTWDGTKGNLAGPGLPFGVGKIMDLPVRVGSTTSAYDAASWLQQGNYLSDLTVFVTYPEAQVAGLPDRNPPLSDGVVGAIPSAGILMYPVADYSSGATYRPSTVDGDLTVLLQPDYSGVAVTQVAYIRAFDAGFSRDAVPVDAEGKPTFRLRIRGLRLSDFAFAAPGPGSAEIAIQVKVPGLTTWMDVGRPDGAGPSKQDALVDGAGCQVIGPETFDARDPVTGIWYSEVKVHVGPAITLYKNDDDEIPVLVRVTIPLAGQALDFTQGGADGTTDDVRGLIGLEIVRPT